MFGLLKLLGALLITLVVLAIFSTLAQAQPPTHLPWQDGQAHYVAQGNNGAYSHNTVYTRYGWDFSMNRGTAVESAAPGTVSKAITGCNEGDYGCDYGWGNSVVVCYGDGTCSRYGHLSAVNVGAGQSVEQAQLLGYSGNTGNSSGPHLHYQLENGSGASLASSFAEAGVPNTGDTVTSRNVAGNGVTFDDIHVYSSDTLDVTAGGSVRAVVTARYTGSRAIPCGVANLGVVGDGDARFVDDTSGRWPNSPWRSRSRVAAVGCSGNLNSGDHARWDLTFRPSLYTDDGTYQVGVFAPVWEGVAWSSVRIPIAVRVHSAFRAAFVDESYPPLTAPGETGRLMVAVRNTGSVAWQKSEVHLGTIGDRSFPYADASWLSPTRISLQENSVAPGDVGHFVANVAPGSSAVANRLRQYFGLVVEGHRWFGSGLGIYLPIYVGDQDHLPFTADDYGATYVRETVHSDAMRVGDTAEVSVTYRNTGQAVLFAAGSHAVHLRGTHPSDRGSGFVDAGSPLGVGNQGVRLPVARVNSGEEFTFRVPVKVAASVAPGTYREYFRPVAEGMTWFGPDDVWFPFTVTK